MVQKVALLTAGGFAPCLSSAIGGLIQRYTEVAPDVEIIAYKYGYQGLLTGDYLTVTDAVAVYHETPVYGSLIGNEQATLTVKNGRVDATIHNVWVSSYADTEGSHAGTVAVHLNFSDPNNVTGSYTISDPTLAPDGVTQDLGEMDKTFTPN